ncbi:hypothetical protein C6502_05260 [Candidatus Poribacteria bacterium]|nr:MAG: hypothetical protein C6502_05260 [Candidatus Poribacteria bacterium]
MKVLIVAKTRMGGGACIGAITEEGESVRLIPFNEDPHDGANREYEVGDIWEISYKPAKSPIPPHMEDVVVYEKHRLGTANNSIDSIERFMSPKNGPPCGLYEGLLQSTESGALYIAEQNGVPPYSTTFWRPDQPLVRDTAGKRVRYRYPTENGGCTLTFVGFQEPLEVIPAGTLLRISLAHWWRLEDTPEVEEKCYAQLSGWFYQEEPKRSIEVKSPPPQRLSQTPPEVLKDVFGYDQFRPLQEKIINHILNRHDALIVLPTGGGKSLCYQLPALIFDGVTVVVSPLISLMQDQVMQLQQRGIQSVFLNSTVSNPEYVATMQRVRQGKVKLLYVAPETLVRPEILLMLDESNVACLAIDEAHCISQWGHDFRPEYRQLVSVLERFETAVCVALTATATPRVREDIKKSLNIKEDNEFIASFDRENLFMGIELKGRLLRQTVTFLNAHRDESGIIYCQTKKQVESLSRRLVERGISALPYHADLDSATRKQNQEAFINGNTRVIVATIAFGMGIDKEDVRFVLHAGLPQNPESYYQEIGRAGRDGHQAECLLLFNYSDIDTIHHFIDQGASAEREGRLDRLQTLIEWTNSIECRRKGLLAYFGEQYEKQNCGMCDNCRKAEMERVDLTKPAHKFLSCIIETKETFGVDHIIKVLRGSKARKVVNNRHNQLSTYGTGREYDRTQWKHLALQFLQHGLLNRDLQHGSLRLTNNGHAVLKGEMQFMGLPGDAADHITIELTTYDMTSGESNEHSHEKHGFMDENRSKEEKGKGNQTYLPSSQATKPIKLYKINNEIEETLFVPEEETFDSSEFEALNLSFEEKIDSCAKVMKNLKAQAAELDAKCEILQEEIQELRKKKQAIENNRKGLVEYVKSIMESLGLKKAGNILHRVTIAQSPLTVEVNIEELDPKWIKKHVSTYPDKRAIIDHIKETGEIPNGVKPIQNTHLRVS